MSLTCGMWQAASGKFIMMIVLIHQNILSMYEFDMRHVADGKRQVYYYVSILKIRKKKIFSKCKFDIWHAAGGKWPVYYDDHIEILK